MKRKLTFLLSLMMVVGLVQAQNHSLFFSRWHSTDANLRNNNVVITNGPALNGTNFTIEAWAKPMQDSSNYMIIGNDSTSNASAPWIILGKAKAVSYGFGNGTKNYSKVCFAAHNNNWNHYAISYNGAVLSLYVNGKLVDTIQRVITVTSKKENSIGGSKFGTSRKYFNGYIDEVRVWNVCRTENEIATTPVNTLVGNESGLIMLYTFEGTATDLTGNSTAVVNNATFVTDAYAPTTYPALTWTGKGSKGTLNLAVTTKKTENIGGNGGGKFDSVSCFAAYITDMNDKPIKSLVHYGGNHAYELWFYEKDFGVYGPDVVSGATQTAHNKPDYTISYNLTWDGKDMFGNLVDDGTYKVKFDLNDHTVGKGTPASTNGIGSNFETTFVKGSNAVAQGPTTDSSFLNATLAWTSSHALTLSRWNSTDANLRNNNVKITNGPALNGTNFTLEAWAKPMQDSTNYMILGNDSTTNASAPYIMLQRAKQIQYGFGTGTASYSKIAAVAHNNNWNHYAVTYDGAVMSLYINGELKDTMQRVATVTNKQISTIGGSKFGTSRKYFNGTIDEVRVWNVSRSANEIANTPVNTLVGNEAGLQMLYTFEGGQALDLTGKTTATVNGGTYVNEVYTATTRPALTWTGNGSKGLLNITFTTDTVPGTGRFGATGATRQQKTKNIFAAYITKADGQVVKTLAHYGQRHSYELFGFNASLGDYAADVNTGATLLAHNTYNLTWDGKDMFGNLVDDGTYFLQLDLNDHSAIYPAPQTKYGDHDTVRFVKGAAGVSVTAPNDTAFKNISLSWAPSHSLELSRWNSTDANLRNNNVKITNGPALNGTNFTLEAWAKPMQDSTNYMILGNDSTTNASAPYIMLQRAKAVQYGFGTGTASYSKIANVAHNNLWNHYAVTYDGAVLSLYVNGVLRDTMQRVATVTNKQISTIGGSKFGTSRKYFKGMIDEVRVWNVCRSANEITNTPVNTLVGNEAGLQMLYTFEGGQALDLTGKTTATVNGGTFVNEGYTAVVRPAFNWLGGGTDGLLNISVTTDTVFGTGRFGATGATRQQKTKNIFVTYITKEDGTFVKSIVHYGARHSYELFNYHATLGNYAPEVNTGATLLVHNTYNLTWDGTDFNGNKVDDGNYFVHFDLNDHSAVYPAPQTIYGDHDTVRFVKGPSQYINTPANDSALKAINVTWNPDGTTGITVAKSQGREVNVYPNPANGEFNVAINEAFSGKVSVSIFNVSGQRVSFQEINKTENTSVISYETKNFPAGLYSVQVLCNTKTANRQIVISK